MIDELTIEAEKNGLTIEETTAIPKKLKGMIVDKEIYIDKSLTKQEKIVVLREEIEHYNLNIGNIIDIRDTSIKKQELIARWSTYEKLLPVEKIIKAIISGVANSHEFAEYVDLPEEFLIETINYYRQRYGTVRFKNYRIEFKNQLRLFKEDNNNDFLVRWIDQFGNMLIANQDKIKIKSSLGVDVINRYEIMRVEILGLNIIVYGKRNEILKIINIPCEQFRNAVKICNEYKKTQTYKFESYIAGITKVNDKGYDIQKLISEYVRKKNVNKEVGKLSLLQEPDNLFDKHAIKVIHDNLGHIGFIPAKHAIKVNSIIENRNIIHVISKVMKNNDSPYYYEIVIRYQ